MTQRRKAYPFAVSILLFEMVALMITVGCYQFINDQPGGREAELNSLYEAAVEAYQTADYQSAAKDFAHIREHSENPLLVRKALYGLACAAIMEAESQDEFIQAISYWHAWVQQAPKQRGSENPLFFNPLVEEKLAIPAADIETASEETASEPNLDRSQDDAARQLALQSWRAITTKIELEQTKQELEKAKGQLSEKQTTIDTLTKELGKLKEQLKAIELIDQKIQEKKKAIPTTE